MSDYSPPPRPGYTKTGKSLKAVRRYYALRDANKKKRAQERRENDREDADKSRKDEQRNQNQSQSKKRRSPDDDFLSKRIANELRVQQEANEKRGRQLNSYLMASTDRSSLPVIAVNPREVGPVFMTKTENIVPRAKSSKSIKSVGDNGLASISTIPVNNISPSWMGCVFAVVVIALVYVITYAIMAAESLSASAPQNGSPDASMKSMGWLAASSLIVIVASSFWLVERKQFIQALTCLMLFIMSTSSLIVYIVYSIVIIKPDDSSYYTKSLNPLNFWLPFTFLIFHLITLGIIIRQNWNLLPKQQQDTGSEERARLSEYMAPA